MTDRIDFCVRCGVNFGLWDPHPEAPSTCVRCYPQLNPSIWTCGTCKRVIEKGERINMDWDITCEQCQKKFNRENGYHRKCKHIAK